MYILGFFQDVGDTIEQALRSLMGLLAATLYTLIENMYKLFNYLAMAEILNNDFVKEIYRKIGLILGIFMIFKLTFSLIQALIEPDKLTDKKSGFASIIGRCVIAIVLLGITPSIFSEAFKIQRFLVGGDNKNNIIYKIIVGKNVSGNFEDMGRVIASNVYFTFFTDDDNNLNKGINDTIKEDQSNGTTYNDRFRTDNYDNLVENVESGNMSFYNTLQYLTVKENGEYAIEFNWLLSILFGIVFVYLMFNYCIQSATRVIQLAYLQLIAPIPILSYISEPDGAFKNWIKQCSTTFLDLFIRLAIIYFIMSVIDNVLEQFNSAGGIIFDSTGVRQDDTTFIGLIKIFIILGLLLFAKRAPELLKDLFPGLAKGSAASLGFGFKKPKDLLNDMFLGKQIGWATKKAAGILPSVAKKGLGYIDRKRYNLPKPRGKFGQTMDKLLPGRGEAIKQRRQAEEDERQYNKSLVEGERIYNKTDGELVATDKDKNITGIKAGIFRHQEYANSLLGVERAKAENKKAEQEYQTEYARYQAAYNSGDEAAIERAENRIKIAERNKKVAAGKLELAQNKHNANKKIYTDDAHREEVFDYYKKTHGKAKEYENEPKTQNNQSTSTTPQNNQQPQSTNNQHQSSSNTPPSVFGNVENYGEDGNPYEAGYGQFTADNTPSGNNNSTYGNDDGNPYETGHGQFNTTGANNSNEDDNPYTNPNYYNNSGQNSSSNNNDEFDGSNYY